MSDHFNEKARTWDADEMVKNLSSAIGESILQRVPLNEDMMVMDFGAGTGLISSQVAPRVRKILAVDISEAMLTRLADKPELIGKVEIVCQDIVTKPIDTRFDLIMSAMAMHHVEDTDELFQTFSAHLKPGGMVALADLDAEDGSFHPEGTEGVFHSGFERSELESTVKRHGFENVQFYTPHTVAKNDRQYPIFLLVATRKA